MKKSKHKSHKALKKKNDKCELYPLEVNFCAKCYNCQLSISVDPKKMFSNYLYTSSTSKVFRDHFVNAANKYVKELKLSSKKSYIIDVGSNDGVALKPFKDLDNTIFNCCCQLAFGFLPCVHLVYEVQNIS